MNPSRFPYGAIAASLLGCTLLAQQPTCQLEGQVLDPMRRPVRGAIVAAEHVGATVARTSTDADGCFVFGKLPQERVRIVATSRDPEVGALWTDLLEAKQHFVYVTTMPARAVHGTVTNQKGEPVAGAFVVAAPASGGKLGPCATTVTSGADGSYRLPHVPLGPCLLRAFAPGHAAWSTEVEAITDEATPIQLDETDATWCTFPLRGDAMPATATIAVQCWHQGEYLPLPPSFTTAGFVDGAFMVPMVAKGDLLEALLTTALATEPRRHTVFGGGRDRVQPFELLQGDAAELRLQISGIEPPRPVRALLQEHDEEHLPQRRIVTIPANGTLTTTALVSPGAPFALRLLDEAFVVRGGATHAWSVQRHVPGQVHAIACEPAHSLRVHVVDERGRPQTGVLVLWNGTTEHGHPWLPLGVGTTGRDGVERLRGLRLADRRHMQLQLRSPHGWFDDMHSADADGSTDLGTCTLHGGGELLLQVVDSDGLPKPGARVMLHGDCAAGQHAAADRQGRLLLTGLPPGPYAATSLHAGEHSPTVQVESGARANLMLQAR